MSSLDEMRISGVRSFSPDYDQVITFSSPLTLILGSNGTGKTTIIECLRYLTTGEYPPPYIKSGKAFIHDPKLADEREVTGKVELKFSDTTGKQVAITREMKGQQKPARFEVNSVYAIIDRLSEQGEKENKSYKIAEFNREMVSSFGVSNAILNNVIFCHQEDSTWPLGEGKALRKRFDEIFAATGYVKALKDLRSRKKKLDGDAREMKIKLDHVEECQSQAVKMKAELESSERCLQMSGSRIERLRNDLEPIDKRLEGIIEKEDALSKLNEELIQKRTELDLVMQVCQELKVQIPSQISGSADELDMAISNFERELDGKKTRKIDTEKRIQSLEEEISSYSAKLGEVLIKVGNLETEAKKHREIIEARDKAARQLHSQYQLSVEICGDGDLSTSKFEEIFCQASEKLRMIAEETDKLKISHCKEEKEFQTRLNSLNESKSRLSQTIVIRKDEMSNNDTEVRDIRSKLLKLKSSVDKLAQVQKTHQQKKCELSTANSLLDEEALNKEIEEEETDIQKLETRMASIDKEMSELHKQTAIRAQLEVFNKAKKSKVDAIETWKSKHEDTLVRIVHRLPNENIGGEVENYTTGLNREIRAAQDIRCQLQVDLALLKTKRDAEKEELCKKEKGLRGCEAELLKVGVSGDLEAAIARLETQIKTLQIEKGSFIGTQYLYNSFIDKLSINNPCCPLCRRLFQQPQDANELIANLNATLTTMPEELKSKQTSIEDNQKELNLLSKMRPIKAQSEKVTAEIPLLKANLQNFEGQIEECTNSLNDLDSNLALKKKDACTLAGLNKDLVLLKQHRLELKDVEMQLHEANGKLGIVGDRTVSIVQEEKTEIQSQIAVLRSSLHDERKRLKDYTSCKIRLQIEVNKLGAELVGISKDAQETTELLKSERQLLGEICKCQADISGIEGQITPIQSEIDEVASTKAAFAIDNENTLDRLRRQQQELNRIVDNMTGYKLQILNYESADTEGKLKMCLEQCKEIENLVEKCGRNKRQLNDDWQNLAKEIDSYQTRLRELKDCRTLKAKEEQLRLLSRSVHDLEAEVEDYDEASLLREKRRLVKERKHMNTEIDQEEGKQKQVEEEITRQKNALQVDMYRDIDKKFTETFVDLKTTRIISSDLHKYYMVLDGTIMEYHTVMMKEINQTIRDLWGKIYKGKDIDYIEVLSDAVKCSQTSRRQIYSYKVVMVKGNVKQDMRGRCSAGQKVLASLIVRLALAETFCANCGILALDEPTTNLDCDNIQSLSTALAEIVELRSAERQFQLIVISHDEEFISGLGHLSSVDFYNKLDKNCKGHSIISHCNMRQSQLE